MFESATSKLKILEEKTIKKMNEKNGVAPEENMFKCQEHNNKAELYCIDCQKMVCNSCLSKGGPHKGHDFQDFGERYDEVKVEIGKDT